MTPEVTAAIKESFAHFEAGRIEPARDILARLVERHPESVEVLCNYAVFLTKIGAFEEAERHARRAVAIEPDQVRGLAILTSVYSGMNRLQEAADVCRRMARIAPENPHTHRALASALLRTNDFAGAAGVARHALEMAPRDADLRLKLGAALLGLGRIDEATRAIDEAERVCPGDVALAQLRAVVSNYAPDLEPRRIFEAHRQFGERFVRALAGAADARPPPVDPAAGEARPLRVGLLSSDLWQHSVAHFARALFDHHAASGVELFAYPTGLIEDAMTITLRRALPEPRFRRASAIAPDAIDAMIRRDGIDVLVDLNGLTRGHSLHTLVRRPAPLLVTYLGYPGTTGLSVVDARIVDSLTDPPGAGDSSCTEALVRLDPCFLCFTPPDGAPPITAPPCADGAGAPVTFGSFNALSKLNDRLLGSWAEVLSAVPGSRLLIKSCGLEHDAVRDDVLARTIAAGIPRERLELAGATAEHSRHLAAYSRIDVALDTFPYHGATTTCDALLMGVPVVTLAGSTHASRVGVSLLAAAGLRELCADSHEHYVTIATAMASDRDRLARLRAELRPRLLASTLCDGPRFAARFFAVMDRLWRERANERAVASAPIAT